MSNIQIIPAILAISEEQFREDLQRIESAEGLRGGWLHLDLADGHFVPNQTVEPEVLKTNPTNLQLEAHLMVDAPNLWVDKLAGLNFKRAIAHVECDSEVIKGFIGKCLANGLEVGLAIKPDTDLKELEPYWQQIGLVLVLSVNPGFQGQPFREVALENIRQIDQLRKQQGFKFSIEVDGHIDDLDARVVVEAGADQLVSGSFLLKGDINENLAKIKETLK